MTRTLSPMEFQNMMVMAVGARPCRVCPKFYRHRQSLARHMDRVHQVDSKTHPILVWWKKLTWRGYERNH